MNIFIVGVGMGDTKYLTKIAEEKIKNADIIIGAKRVAEPYVKEKKVFFEYETDKIKKILEENKCYLKEWLKAHPHLSCVIPKYGPVCFLQYDYKIDSNTFCETLQEETGVFFVPGCCFDVENHLRFGLANDPQIVKEGLEVFSNWLKKLDTSR